jgi:predicted amidohydrolase YtcJ
VGSLRPGAWADVVVLSEGVEAVERGALPEIRAVYLGASAVAPGGAAGA